MDHIFYYYKMSNIAEYCTQALAVVEALKKEGYNAEFIERINVAKIVFKHEKDPYYVYNPVDFTKYGNKFIINDREMYGEYKHTTDYVLDIYRYKIHINGVTYIHHNGSTINYSNGHINGNEFISYKGKWIKKDSFIDMIKTRKIHTGIYAYVEDDILDSDFMPARPQIINIKTDGFKLVCNSRIVLDSDLSDSFTFFNNYHECISDGKYTEICDDDLFDFENEDGERFVLLNDIQADEYYLVSNTKCIKTTKAESCLAKYENGLYNGYDIIDNGYFSEKKEYYDLGYEVREDDVEFVCQYKDKLFLWYTEDHQSIMLADARKPGSGAKTKAAQKDDECNN